MSDRSEQMTDDALHILLGRAAAAAPLPLTKRPGWLGDEAPAPEVPAGRSRWRTRLLAAAAVVVALAIGSRVLDDPERTDAPAAGGPAAGGAATASPAASGAGTGTGSVDATLSPAGTGAVGGAGTAGAGAAAGSAAALPAAAPRIVQRGVVAIEVAEGAFSATLEQLAGLATGLGGHVASTQSSESGEHPRGTIVLRVPTAAFEQLAGEVRRLGAVLSASTMGEDVTASYTDLEARLVALRASRDQLLLILGEAEAIGDILAVQDRLNIVNLDIESTEGRRRLLEDQSGFGTLDVTVSEPGDESNEPVPAPAGDGGLGGAWDEARRGFGDALEWLVARSGKAAVFAVAALALFAASGAARRRLRRAAL